LGDDERSKSLDLTYPFAYVPSDNAQAIRWGRISRRHYTATVPNAAGHVSEEGWIRARIIDRRRPQRSTHQRHTIVKPEPNSPWQ
jgi:hypothetical protein